MVRCNFTIIMLKAFYLIFFWKVENSTIIMWCEVSQKPEGFVLLIFVINFVNILFFFYVIWILMSHAIRDIQSLTREGRRGEFWGLLCDATRICCLSILNLDNLCKPWKLVLEICQCTERFSTLSLVIIL